MAGRSDPRRSRLAPGGEHQAEDAALPGLVEDGLVGLGLDGAEAVHAPHVVHRVRTCRP